MDHVVAGRRRERTLRRLEAGCGGPLRAATRHLCEGARSAVPPRGLQPVFVEYVLGDWNSRSSSARILARAGTMAQDSRASIPCSIAPWLSVRDGEQAVAFYKAAFGATEVYRLQVPEGGGVVVRLSVAGAEFWVSGESSDDRNAHPEAEESLGGGSVRMILTVADPDAVFARAVAA